MRYISQLFQPIITIPKNAKIKNTEITCKSQKLLVECGLVRPTSSGFFTVLPLARRALDKLETLIRTCMENAGCQRVSLPYLTPESLWEKTGRLSGGGPELIKVKDRHDKRFLLAPTHEETVADLFADVGPLSYKQLPLLLYQIGNKYRDEHRPKHGLLRAREFSMLDAYGAHAHHDCARHTYARLTHAYQKLFDELKLPVHRVEAPTGEMGGSLSHEWQVEAEVGEDKIDICPSCSLAVRATEERGRPCDHCDNVKMTTVNSIEVGHTFILGEKYSEPLQALFTSQHGNNRLLIMSCYGIGITRLLAACLETLSTDRCLRWPTAIAPYSTIIIGPKEGSKEWQYCGPAEIAELAQKVAHSEDDVLIDDRHHLTIGKRIVMAEKMGYPRIVVCGKSLLDSPPSFEVYECTPQGGTKEKLLPLDELCTIKDEIN